MKKSKKTTKLIEVLNTLVDQIIAYIDDIENVPFDKMYLPKKGDEMYVELQRRHAMGHFDNMISSMRKKYVVKAKSHAAKLKKQIAPVANDYPFEKGDRVSVHRYEHGFNMGWEAVIKDVYQSCNGVYRYEATVLDSDYDSNFDITIEHTRDAYRI